MMTIYKIFKLSHNYSKFRQNSRKYKKINEQAGFNYFKEEIPGKIEQSMKLPI